MKPVDYQPLTTIDDIQVDGQQIDLSKPKRVIFKSLRKRDQISIIILIILAVLAAIPTEGLGALLILAVPVIIYTGRLEKQKERAWAAFALANGFTIVPAKLVTGLVPPTTLTNGHSHKNSDAITAD